MNTIIEKTQQIYLQRIHQLYSDIKTWLQDEPLIVENGEIEVIEALGRYKAPRLSIKTQEGEVLAELKPTGTATLLSEGKIDIDGWVDSGYLLYMRKNYPQTFFEIDKDNWYWFEERLDVKPHSLKEKHSLLEMITWVSDYELIHCLR